MATTTPNFGWPVPTSTDLVKDGATAMEALGDAIDTSMVDLKGGTTGQVLAKASNTDMDFSWVAQDDSNAVQNTIVDAKGDLIAASAADTPARLAVGSNGETIVADSLTSTGLRYQGNYAAGKNAIINGDFKINQRSFSSTTTSGTYGFDRWLYNYVGGTNTYSAQTFTAGAAPVAGYEGTNFARLAQTGQTTQSQYSWFEQKIEDVRTFANRPITVSFWAKAASGTPFLWVEYQQNFGSGGSTTEVGQVGSTVTLSTTWTRYSVTVNLPSITGATIGTSSFLSLFLWTSLGSSIRGYANATFQNATIDIWGVQVETGSVATAFQTATGTIAGELVACQRYYYRNTGGSTYSQYGMGVNYSTTGTVWCIEMPVTMRIEPTTLDYSSLTVNDPGIANYPVTALVIDTNESGPKTMRVNSTVASGLVTSRTNFLTNNNNAAGFIGFSAEL